MDRRILVERLTLALGMGTVAFGIGPFLFPRPFARLFGLPIVGGPGGEVAVRSVGARDAIVGAGILSATIHRGRVAPWLLARALADGTDFLAVALAWGAGNRNVRLLTLGGIAAAATALDGFLYVAQKVQARTPVELSDKNSRV